METKISSEGFFFPAGEMIIKDNKVSANPDRGVLRFFINKETQLLSLKWENIAKKTSNDEIIITPGEYIFKKVSTKKGSPFFIVNVEYPDDKHFYYFQTKNKENLEKLEQKIIDILSKGELPPDESDKSKLVPMSIEELNNKDNNTNIGTNPTQTNQINQNFMKNFTDILKKMQQKYPSLGKILTTEKITKLFESLDDENKKRLIDLLPEKQKTKQGFYDNINSAQFKQGLGSLTAALESENLAAIISSFGLDINVAQKCGDGVEAFVKSIIAKYSPKEDKKEEKKEEKK